MCSLREDGWMFTSASVFSLSRYIVLVDASQDNLASQTGSWKVEEYLYRYSAKTHTSMFLKGAW